MAHVLFCCGAGSRRLAPADGIVYGGMLTGDVLELPLRRLEIAVILVEVEQKSSRKQSLTPLVCELK